MTVRHGRRARSRTAGYRRNRPRRPAALTSKPASSSSAGQLVVGREVVALGRLRAGRRRVRRAPAAPAARRGGAPGAARQQRAALPSVVHSTPRHHAASAEPVAIGSRSPAPATAGRPNSRAAARQAPTIGSTSTGARRTAPRRTPPGRPRRRRRRPAGRPAASSHASPSQASADGLPLPRQPAGMAWSGPSRSTASWVQRATTSNSASMAESASGPVTPRPADDLARPTAALTPAANTSPRSEAIPDRFTPAIPSMASSGAWPRRRRSAIPAATGSGAPSTAATCPASRCRPGKLCSTAAERSSV